MLNLANRRFGRLVALCPTNKRKDGRVIWVCRCDCGKLAEVKSHHLLTEHTKSCGCIHKEIMADNKLNLKHGATNNGILSRSYITWRSMKQRYLNPNHPAYKYYGGRGIKVCDEWLNSYEAFRDWALSNGYADNLTIDRIDNDGNYEPSNCQWITRSENSKKKGKKCCPNGKQGTNRQQDET